MSDINNALAIALESEHEAEAVENTYSGLAQVLDIENSMGDVSHATDVAVGLENLQIVLESIKELDINDVAMIQVIGDIAGASSGGLPGAMFTPAMESVDDTGASAGEKAKSIGVKIGEMIDTIIEKIRAFIKWMVERLGGGLKALKEAGELLAANVGMAYYKPRYDALKQRLVNDLDFIKSLTEYMKVTDGIVETFMMFGSMKPNDFSNDPGFSLNPRYFTLVNHSVEEMKRFSRAFDRKEYVCGASYEVDLAEIAHGSANDLVMSYNRNFIKINDKGYQRPEYNGEELARLGHDLVSAIEDVHSGFSTLMDSKSKGSVAELLNKTHAQMTTLRNREQDMIADSPNNGMAIANVLSRAVNGIRFNVSMIAKISTIVDREISSLASEYKNLPQAVKKDAKGLAPSA